ncbi:hypothetical protein ACQUEP_13315 [Enterococcus casseliflavus]|uniref:hypothetical protein n=1 Tax=Enterococcus casseliflavus TaxID=37734 RepID=UPI00288E78B9|nr:hypothetical protein [Enterococcus casseliflavus]MDT2987290.1 hypothetical protein [Enterococcus casseliflavus]
MEHILTAATVIVGVVMAVTGLVKKMIPDNRLLPVINIFLGTAVGIVYAATMAPDQMIVFGWAGFLSGLAAGGFYDLGAGFIKDSNAKPDYGDGQEFTEKKE